MKSLPDSFVSNLESLKKAGTFHQLKGLPCGVPFFFLTTKFSYENSSFESTRLSLAM